MSKANVLHVIDTLNVGGAEKLLVGIVNGLPQFNHHVIYLCGSNKLGKDLPASCQVVKLDFRTKWDTPACVIRLRRYIKKNKIDVVHSHLVMSTVITRLACPKNVQLFNTIHSMLGSRCFAPGKRMQRFIERLCYRKRHHVIAVSENVYHDYNNCIGIKGKHTVLPNFVEDKFFTADYKRMNFNGTFRMVTVGNLKPAKNYPFLIEAFKKLPKGIHLDIYGDGPLKNELQAAIEKHRLNIRLCGPHENVHQVLTQYDMFVMSSLVEGQPVALLEAMASGMPAALSDIPALREATGSKAIFYDLNNVNEFVDKITAIANHQVDLDEYAKANFERIKNMAGKKNYMSTLSTLYMSKQLEEISFMKKTVPGVSILMPGNLHANTHVAG
jgi:glycosyltransferase involved in cell wall biosynthesis